MSQVSERGAIGRVFWILLAVAIASVIALTVANQHPGLIVLSGLAPLILYHAKLYRANGAAGGVPQSTVDTVYYFGFIVTIAALAGAVLVIANNPEALTGTEATKQGALQRVGMTFGLGLIATGYALSARIQLMIQSSHIDEETVAEQVARVEQEVSKTLLVVQRAALEFEALSMTLIAGTRQTTETILQGAVSALEHTSQRAAADYSQAGSAVRAAATELGVAMRAALPAEETQALLTAVKESGGALGTLQVRINKLAEKTQQLDSVIESLNATLSGGAGPLAAAVQSLGMLQVVAERLTELAPVVSTVSGELASVSSAASRLQTVMREVWEPSAHDATEVGNAMHRCVAALDSHAAALSEAEKTVRREVEWRTQVTTQALPIDSLHASISTLNQELVSMASNVSRLGQSFNNSEVPRQMELLQEGVDGLRQKLSALGETTGRVVSNLSNMAAVPHPAGQADTAQLDKIARLLEDNVKQLSDVSRRLVMAPMPPPPAARSWPRAWWSALGRRR